MTAPMCFTQRRIRFFRLAQRRRYG